MYAGWLTSSALAPMCPGAAPPVPYYGDSSLVPPPDVLLEVGNPPITSRFWAHNQIICQYSGYLRSAVTSSRNLFHGTASSDLKPIRITNVSVEQFQPLLQYMYTGFLDLTMDNIFAVLLAAHVLHMPHALDICRGFLSRMQAQGLIPAEEPPTNFNSSAAAAVKTLILKPIPSKATTQMPLLAATISCPSAPHVLVPSSRSTFQTLYPAQSQPPKEITALKVDPQPSTPPQRISATPKTHQEKKAETQSVEPATPPVSISKTVLDIASCDGPVRFHRVANKFYSHHQQPTVTDSPRSSTASSSTRIQQFTNSSFNQQMARDINERRLYEEPQTTITTSSSQDTDHGSSSSSTFKCTVCNHNFKSEYCYLKHSKRHLIPIVVEPEPGDGSAGLSDNNTENSIQHSHQPRRYLQNKAKLKTCSSAYGHQTREVIRPLDMNVQYYPCKTCGSKFPSYYFVHKHRKMCHPTSDTETAAATLNTSPEGDSRNVTAHTDDT